jgi:hypothetical protein
MIAAVISYWLRRIGTRSKTINTQLIAATLYGLMEFYGVRGTILIVMKARKLAHANKRNLSRVRQGSNANPGGRMP